MTALTTVEDDSNSLPQGGDKPSYDLRLTERLVDGYGSNMKASRQILRVLFLGLKFLILGFDRLFPRSLMLDYPDVSLGGSRADLSL
jgi:hypothetical protein